MAFVHSWRRVTVYAVAGDDGVRRWHYTLRPRVDAAYWRLHGAGVIMPLEPPAPAMWAEYALRMLRRAEASRRRLRPPDSGPPASARLADTPRFSPTSVLPSQAGARSSIGLMFRKLAGRLLGCDPSDLVVFRVNAALQVAGYPPGLRPGPVVRLSAAGPVSLAVDDNPSGLQEAGRPRTCEVDESADPGLDFDPARIPPLSHVESVAAALAGRQLSIREVERFIERERPEIGNGVSDCLAWLAVTGRVRQMPGVQRSVLGGLRCMRCGETERLRAWDCAVCGEEECWTCEACRSLGEVRSCTVLYAAGAGPSPECSQAGLDGFRVSVLVPSSPRGSALGGADAGASTVASARERESGGVTPCELRSAPTGKQAADTVRVHVPPLTPVQERASKALADFVDGERTDALVWAACGAGKTEISFAAVAKVLARGGRVLFAVPRRDVVRELGRRLQAAFPDVERQILHGGADRAVLPVLSPGSLTVATTHQVMRFYRAFDLVLLDEVDAFPYRGSRMLAEAVVRAAAPGGRRIRMTATPDNDLLRQAEAGEGVLIRVPARYHGYPLPVPELVVDRSLGDALRADDSERKRPFKPSRLLTSLIERSFGDVPVGAGGVSRARAGTDAIDRVAPNSAGDLGSGLPVRPGPARVLVFVPTVALSEWVGRGLAQRMSGDVLWSHSRDPERDAKVAAFLRGRARVFVATSILERGVTVPDVDVIVLFADAERIFQEPALIQMAGRVGRTAERPTGRVAFVGRRITAAMRRAVAHIESMNEEASALGLLRSAAGPRHGGGGA